MRVDATAAAPARHRRATLRDWLEYGALRTVAGLLNVLPHRLALGFSAAVAGLAIRLDRRHRRIGLTNLAIAFPEKTERERLAILIASYRNLGRMVAECARLGKLDARNVRDVVRIEDEALWSQLPAALEENGLLVLTGHFGNWELFAYAHGLLGHPVHLVAQTIKNPLIDGWLMAMRERGGTRTLRKHRAARAVLETLDRHGLMVLPLDQNASRRTGVFVEFFGRLASTNSGFARIALRADVPIYPAFLVRDGESARHRIVILPRVPIGSMANRESAAHELTQRCTAILEEMIRRYPDHWLWTHKRWRTRPAGEPEIYKKD